MKKITLFVLSICFVSVLSAQAPPTITSGKWWVDDGNTGDLTGSKAFQLGLTTRSRTSENPETRAITPIAPATLLLLGLGGAAVGTTVLKNTRKK